MLSVPYSGRIITDIPLPLSSPVWVIKLPFTFLTSMGIKIILNKANPKSGSPTSNHGIQQDLGVVN